MMANWDSEPVIIYEIDWLMPPSEDSNLAIGKENGLLKPQDEIARVIAFSMIVWNSMASVLQSSSSWSFSCRFFPNERRKVPIFRLMDWFYRPDWKMTRWVGRVQLPSAYERAVEDQTNGYVREDEEVNQRRLECMGVSDCVSGLGLTPKSKPVFPRALLSHIPSYPSICASWFVYNKVDPFHSKSFSVSPRFRRRKINPINEMKSSQDGDAGNQAYLPTLYSLVVICCPWFLDSPLL